jgi:hypothetical protein
MFNLGKKWPDPTDFPLFLSQTIQKRVVVWRVFLESISVKDIRVTHIW